MMKKLLTTIILILCCTYLQAQPPSVAGVQFGTTYEQAKLILDKRFNGGEESYQLEKDALYYYNVEFAGEKFDIVCFHFETDVKRSYLSGVNFSKVFKRSEGKEATNMQNRLYERYKKKYEFRWETDGNDGHKRYVLGRNYFDNDKGFVVIVTTKGKGKRYTNVLYICNGFVNTQNEI